MQAGRQRPVVSHEVSCLREILAGCVYGVCVCVVHESEKLKLLHIASTQDKHTHTHL